MPHTRPRIPAGSPSPSPASVHPLETSLPEIHGWTPAPDPGPSDAYRTNIDPRPTLSTVFRHSGWAHDRDRVYEALRRTGQSLNRVAAFAQCGSTIRVYQSTDDPNKYRLGGSYCHDRLCLPCGNARSRVIATNLLNAIPKGRTRFLTLTLQVENESLEVQILKMQKSFARLLRSELWRERVTGGAAFLEVKRSSKSENWHVHYHALLAGRYIPQDQLSQLWYTITGDSTIVDIRPAGDPESVSRYITKYASKPINSDFLREPDLLDEAIIALKRRRLCKTFGILRGVSLTKAPTDDAWESIGTLDDFLCRERDGDEKIARILAILRSAGMDDARHCLRSRPHPRPPPKKQPNKLPRFSHIDPDPWS